MTGIAIYVEGGGETRHLQASLRIGFDELLRRQKEAARNKRLRWRLVCEGDRNQAFESFRNAIQTSPATDVSVLLVDAEEPCHLGPVNVDSAVEVQARLTHLHQRDGWSFTGINGDRVHLMVRAMEAWIVADPAALAGYYKQGFKEGQLPARLNLEEEPKTSLFKSLANATRASKTKGEYKKRRHAAELLPLLDTAKIAKRCPRFGVFTTWLDELIAAAP